MRSETVNTIKNTALNDTPAMVASGLVKRLTRAVANSTSEISATPMGISTEPMWMLPGTRNSRSPGSVKRSTSTASDMKEKLQITPKAYSAASR